MTKSLLSAALFLLAASAHATETVYTYDEAGKRVAYIDHDRAPSDGCPTSQEFYRLIALAGGDVFTSRAEQTLSWKSFSVTHFFLKSTHTPHGTYATHMDLLDASSEAHVQMSIDWNVEPFGRHSSTLVLKGPIAEELVALLANAQEKDPDFKPSKIRCDSPSRCSITVLGLGAE